MSPFIVGIVTSQNLEKLGLEDELRQCDAWEFRGDTFGENDLIPALKSIIHMKLPEKKGILTIRLKKDGGNWQDQKSSNRIEWVERCLNEWETQTEGWLDWEAEQLDELPKNIHQKLDSSPLSLLVSHHDFNSCPNEKQTQSWMRRVEKNNGFKLACFANSLDETVDFINMARTIRGKPKWGAFFSMGEIAACTRFLMPLLGWRITYAPVLQKAVAPGQLKPGEIRKLAEDASKILSAGDNSLHWLKTGRRLMGQKELI